jgi:hypothetical protein
LPSGPLAPQSRRPKLLDSKDPTGSGMRSASCSDPRKRVTRFLAIRNNSRNKSPPRPTTSETNLRDFSRAHALDLRDRGAPPTRSFSVFSTRTRMWSSPRCANFAPLSKPPLTAVRAFRVDHASTPDGEREHFERAPRAFADSPVSSGQAAMARLKSRGETRSTRARVVIQKMTTPAATHAWRWSWIVPMGHSFEPMIFSFAAVIFVFRLSGLVFAVLVPKRF